MTIDADPVPACPVDGGGTEALLDVREVALRFGGIVALDGLSFQVAPGQICGLIGPNGAGKTSAFNVLSRIYRPHGGTVAFAGRSLLDVPAHRVSGLGIGRTFQNLALFPAMSLLDNVIVGAHSAGTVGFARAVSRLGVAAENRRTRQAAADLLEQLGLADLMHTTASGLPFGTLKRVEIARALAGRPKLLLLDEPAAGLTHREVDELGSAILAIRDDFDLTILLVEHHMSLVMHVSDQVVAMNFGRVIANGRPRDVAQDPRVVEAYLGAGA